MAYADQNMSNNRIVALVLVALIHILVGYALVSGLAYSAVENVIERVTTVDIDEPEEEPDEPEPEPEPQEVVPPPPVAPPPPINISTTPPDVRTTTTITENNTVDTNAGEEQPTYKSCPGVPGQFLTSQACPEPTKACPDGSRVPVSQNCAPEMENCWNGQRRPKGTCPPEPDNSRAVSPRNQGSWAGRIQRNYPSRAAREGREGRVRVSVQVGANGRVSSCSVTGSSGHNDLDQAACRGMQRYARFNAAKNKAGNEIASSWSTTIVYQLQ